MEWAVIVALVALVGAFCTVLYEAFRDSHKYVLLGY